MNTRRNFLRSVLAAVALSPLFVRAREAMETFQEPATKAQQVAAYIEFKCADDPTFDHSKLMLMMFHIDMDSFARTGNTITGCEYRKTLTSVEIVPAL